MKSSRVMAIGMSIFVQSVSRNVANVMSSAMLHWAPRQRASEDNHSASGQRHELSKRQLDDCGTVLLRQS
jgi:hypothetical protein